MGDRAGKLAVGFKALQATIKASTRLAKSGDKHAPTAKLALVQYVGAERMQRLFGQDQAALFVRTESAMTMMQFSVPVIGKPTVEDGTRYAVAVANLNEALTVVGKKKPAEVEIHFQKTGIKIGSIRIRAEDPAVFEKPPAGITKAPVIGNCLNPYMAVARLQHCVGDEGIPSIAVLPGSLLAAHRAQAILVDCEILDPRSEERVMVPAAEMMRVEHFDDHLSVRISSEYLVFRGETGMLAIRRLRWSSTMDEAMTLFQSAQFVDRVEVDREGLLEALKASTKILGNNAAGEIKLTPEGGSLHSVEEGNEVSLEFDCVVSSGSTYILGLVLRMLLKAIECYPEPDVVFQIPNISGGPGNMIHLVDPESHEVIALGITGQLRKQDGTAQEANPSDEVGSSEGVERAVEISQESL